MKVKDFLNKDNWTKNHMARDRFGQPVGPLDEAACSWCILGAFRVCYGTLGNEYYRLAKNVESGLVTIFNDSATWEQVSELLSKTDV